MEPEKGASMKRHPYHTLVLLSVLLCICLLCGCGKKENGPTGADSANGQDSTGRITEIKETYEEDDSYQSVVIDQSWDDYEVTTNEIGYDPREDHLEEDGYYTSEEDVASYIIEYGTLPDNFNTKKEARDPGWTGGGLDDYAEDCSIGGDYFGNYEGLLPKVKGRNYYECDIDTMNARKRGSKRIIYSDDGQIYYTDDHYESFTLIYGTDDYP